MKITLPTLLALLLATAGIQTAHAQTRYDFGYRISDDRIQIFDDGQHTRIVLPEGTLTPTVVAVQPSGEVLLMPSRDGTNLVFGGIYTHLIIRWSNGREVVANYQGEHQVQVRNGKPAAFGAVQPVAGYGTPPPPVYRAPDAVQPVVSAPTPATAATAAIKQPPVEPRVQNPSAQTTTSTADLGGGLRDDSPKSTANTASSATQSVASAVAKPLQEWQIRNTDGTLSKALARWAASSTPPISWEAEKDFPATNATYHGTYFEVLEQVMRDTARSQYPLHACVYQNVIRVLHASQSCVR